MVLVERRRGRNVKVEGLWARADSQEWEGNRVPLMNPERLAAGAVVLMQTAAGALTEWSAGEGFGTGSRTRG